MNFILTIHGKPCQLYYDILKSADSPALSIKWLLIFSSENCKGEERSGPYWLDSLTADLRWKPPSVMPPVLLGYQAVAVSSMPHRVSCRPVKNEDALHCSA